MSNVLKKLLDTYKKLYGKLTLKDFHTLKEDYSFNFNQTFTDKNFVKNFLLKEIKKQILIEIKPFRTKFRRKK